jgi:hypothetical protein
MTGGESPGFEINVGQMTDNDKTTKTVTTKPQKVLLHMARKDNDWAGKATCFSGGEEYVFDNLEDLFAWLRRPKGKSHHTPAIKLNDGDKSY